MMCIETSGVGPGAGDLWKQLLAAGSEVRNVHLLSLSFLQRLPLRRLAKTQGGPVASIGGLAAIPPKELRFLRWLSDYGGHLNVLYEAESTDVVVRIISLWPGWELRSAEPIGITGLGQQAKAALVSAVNALLPEALLFGFSHDAADAFVFGREEYLKGALDMAASRAGRFRTR